MAEIVAGDPADYSTLVTALQAADLVGTLSGPGPFTVFAPTNKAFAALPAGVPAAVFVGAKDPIVDPRTGQLLVDAAEAAGGAGAARPEVIIFPQAGHQLIAVDKRWKTHVDAVATWVMAQLA